VNPTIATDLKSIHFSPLFWALEELKLYEFEDECEWLKLKHVAYTLIFKRSKDTKKMKFPL
jgi:hypothetical protein